VPFLYRTALLSSGQPVVRSERHLPDLLSRDFEWLAQVAPIVRCLSPYCVLGFVFARVAQVEMVLVERELVFFEDPTLPTRAVEGFGPVVWSYNLVWSLLQGYAGDRPTYVQNVRVGAVAPDGFAVDPAYIGGPAIVVRVGQAAGVVSEVHTGSWATSLPLSSREPSTPAVRRTLSISYS
jgi:hypothetical protein